MQKVLLLALALTLLTSAGFSQDQFWSANNESRNNIIPDKAVARQSYPTSFKLFNLQSNLFRQQVLSVVGANALGRSTTISLPNADGNLEQYEVFEASNFEPDLQARFPEIRAYSGKGITDPYATLKLSVSPDGIQAMIFRTGLANEFVEPYSRDHTVYSVFRSKRERGSLPWTCSTQDQVIESGLKSQVATASATGGSTGVLKTLRLAQSCNGEYSNWFNAFSSADVARVLTAFNNTLTRCNGVYEKDLALHLNLISNTTSVIYYNPATDPYTTMSNWNNQLQTTLTNVIGESNYDIGHMFGASGGGGNAGCIGCVCVNGSKGRGITSPADGIPQGDDFDIDYVVHEVGHQLGANHTFSHGLESGTGVNKEVGSGITIMGYAGITSYDVAPHSIAIFHEASIAQIQANLANKTCPVSTNITANNAAPVIGAVTNRIIPISTPFALTASASDANGDPITYCWEQNDNATTSGSSSVASPTKLTGPNWISFLPTTSGTRLFPKLATILAGSNISGPLPGGDAVANTEALSSVSRTLNFRLTVRDNHPYSSSAQLAVGQTAFTDVVVTVTNTSGPFVVTSPNTNITWTSGGPATVTWNVANTTLIPVSCNSVNILLSTDGGITFPTVLVSGTPNDGSESITVPNTPGTTNRVKVEAAANIFFDISNAHFTISAAAGCGTPTGPASSAITETSATISWTAVSGATSYAVDYKPVSSGTWTGATNNTTSTSVNLSGLSSGTLYDWRVRATCASGTSSYLQAQFTTATPPPPCGNVTGLTSSEITETTATITWSSVSGASNYDVDFKQVSSGTWDVGATATTSTSLVLAGLTEGTDYDWRVRANCASGTGNYSQAQFTTTASPSNCPGTLDVSANGTPGGAATIPFNTNVFGLINPKGDNDYYRFDITTGGTIALSLSNLPTDYQLALVSGNTTLQSSTNPGTAPESITRAVTPGTYYARVYPRNNGAQNASICYTLNVQFGTGREPVTVPVFTVSPNPAGYRATLDFKTGTSGMATVSVLSQAGRVVLSKNIVVLAGTNRPQISVANLANGMYFIKIQTGAVVQMAKLVVGK